MPIKNLPFGDFTREGPGLEIVGASCGPKGFLTRGGGARVSVGWTDELVFRRRCGFRLRATREIRHFCPL